MEKLSDTELLDISGGCMIIVKTMYTFLKAWIKSLKYQF